MNKIITIGREFGSGGRELGKRIAEALGIAYYDKEIINEIAKKTELAVDYVSQIVEKKPIIYYPITIGHTLTTYGNSINSVNASVYSEQRNVIRELATKSSCVIVGCCADYILKDLNPFRIFVYADIESRMERCRIKGEAAEDVTDKKLKKMIKAVDKHRCQYYEFYTSNEWGNKLNYDLCINTSNKSIKDLCKDIVEVLK